MAWRSILGTTRILDRILSTAASMNLFCDRHGGRLEQFFHLDGDVGKLLLCGILPHIGAEEDRKSVV